MTDNHNPELLRKRLAPLQIGAAIYGYSLAILAPMLFLWSDIILFVASLFVKKERGNIAALHRMGVPDLPDWWALALSFEGWFWAIWLVLFFVSWIVVAAIEYTSANIFKLEWSRQFISNFPDPHEPGWVQREYNLANGSWLTVIDVESQSVAIWKFRAISLYVFITAYASAAYFLYQAQL